jgi:hypothetical protein
MTHARTIVLCGGSAFGLEAASGVTRHLADEGIGFDAYVAVDHARELGTIVARYEPGWVPDELWSRDAHSRRLLRLPLEEEGTRNAAPG